VDGVPEEVATTANTDYEGAERHRNLPFELLNRGGYGMSLSNHL